MGASRLEGPYRLSYEGIEVAVRRASPGVFALGCLDREGRFSLSKVGRSDDDVRRELRNFIGSETLFKFAFARDARAAFLLECELYHRFRPQSNVLHPSRPERTDLTCPYCQGKPLRS